jgi:resuscitation-promoting factor RpfA
MTNTTNDPAANEESTAAWGTTSFVPGNDVGLVARHTVGLIERNNPSTRERLWGLVATDAPLDDILDELSSTGLKSLPDFGIAQVDGENIRVVARGRTVVTAELGTGATHVVDATTVRTWIEEALSDVVAVTIALAAASDDDVVETGAGDTFAVLAGSVPAASLTRRYDEPDRHAAAAEAWVPSSGPTDEAAEQGGAEDDDQQDDDQQDDDQQDDDQHDDDQHDDDESDLVSTDLEFSTGDASADGMEDVATDSPPIPAASDTSWFEDPDSSGIVTPGDAQPSDPQPAPPAFGVADDARPEILPPSGPAPDSTIILGADDAATRVPTVAPFDAEADLAHSLGDDVDDGEQDGVDADGVGGQFGSNDMTATVVGSLAFSNGTRLDVDRSVLIGRNPKVSGSVDGPLPHIMKFEGPGQGLSRTHAEIRIEGGEMVLEDLQSTNGTEVELPGEPRRRLHGGDPVVIVPGTLIDFGDDLHCTVESAW